jgi:hypothetical protein
MSLLPIGARIKVHVPYVFLMIDSGGACIVPLVLYACQRNDLIPAVDERIAKGAGQLKIVKG